ncbi:hypothetical protein G159_04445 [Planococcus glaciei CHR43]|nr:hypothetical protein G159_04445 [Planococcus glaciei CHR43]
MKSSPFFVLFVLLLYQLISNKVSFFKRLYQDYLMVKINNIQQLA